MKKALSLLIAVFTMLFLFSTFAYAADVENEQNINIKIDELSISFNDDSGYPYIDENNRTMVPLRLTMEKARCVVDYEEETKTAIVTKDNINIKVPIGTNFIVVNGVSKENDTASVVFNGRTYLPIRAVLEAVGYLVAWDGSTNTVLVNKPYSQHPMLPHFRSVNGSSVIDELSIKNGMLYYCASWGGDVKLKYLNTLEKFGYLKTGNEVYNKDLTVSTELKNTSTGELVYVCVQDNSDGSKLAYVTIGENKTDALYSFDTETMKLVCESQPGNSNIESTKSPADTTYISHEEVPLYTSVCTGKLEYESENIKVYSSSDFDKYLSFLTNNYTQSGKETYKIKNTQAATQYVDVHSFDVGKTKVTMFELEDDGLDEKFVFIYLNESFYYPTYSEIIAEIIDSRDKNIGDVDKTYKGDKNNYLYGYNPNIYSSRIYERKADVSSVKEFERFLKHKYAYLYSPMEDFELDVEIWDNSTSSEGTAFVVHVDFSFVSSDYDVITPYNFKEKYGYSDSQKEETLELLKSMMKDICADAEDCFPQANVSGCIYVSGYHYPHIKVDYYDDTALSWSNSSGSFKWQPSLDTFEIY